MSASLTLTLLGLVMSTAAMSGTDEPEVVRFSLPDDSWPAGAREGHEPTRTVLEDGSVLLQDVVLPRDSALFPETKNFPTTGYVEASMSHCSVTAPAHLHRLVTYGSSFKFYGHVPGGSL